MLSSHFLQTKIKARANLGQYWGCHIYIWEKRKMKISRQEKNLELFPCSNTCRKNKCLESYAFPTCIDGGWSRWMWPLMPFSRSIEQPHSTVHMLCASSQRDMYLTFTQSMFVCIFVFVCICVWVCFCVRLCVLVCECLFTSNAQTNFLSIEASALTIP